MFPRDPAFAAKGGRVLDLYQRRWCDRELGDGEFVVSVDEKTSIQPRCQGAEEQPGAGGGARVAAPPSTTRPEGNHTRWWGRKR